MTYLTIRLLQSHSVEGVVKGLNVKIWCISYDYVAVGSGNFPLGFAKQNEWFYIIMLFELAAVPKRKKSV